MTAEDFEVSKVIGNDLTAELNLSDENLGVAPMIQDNLEETPMFAPRTSSRIVRIISKQSNVWYDEVIVIIRAKY